MTERDWIDKSCDNCGRALLYPIGDDVVCEACRWLQRARKYMPDRTSVTLLMEAQLNTETRERLRDLHQAFIEASGQSSWAKSHRELVTWRTQRETLLDAIPELLHALEDAEAALDRVTRQRDDARFIADKKHEMIEKLYASQHDLREAVRVAELERDHLRASIDDILDWMWRFVAGSEPLFMRLLREKLIAATMRGGEEHNHDI